MKLIEHLPYSLSDGFGATARIGLVVLASDYTIDHEFREVFVDSDIDYFSARVANSPNITPQTLAAMKEKIAGTLSLILPEDKLDVVAYACTSASVVLGEQTVFSEIRKVHPNAACTTPITAAFRAFDAMGAKRIAVLTPYTEDVNKTLSEYIVNAGYEVPVFGSFNEALDPVVARIDEASIVNAVNTLLQDTEVDMVFISCTSVRFMQSVVQLESSLGIPVTSSNHALAWHCLRLAGSRQQKPGLGRLFNEQLPV